MEYKERRAFAVSVVRGEEDDTEESFPIPSCLEVILPVFPGHISFVSCAVHAGCIQVESGY